jgi:hypothetical protein
VKPLSRVLSLIAFQRLPDPTCRVAPWIVQPWAAGLFHVAAALEDPEMEPSKRELIESVFGEPRLLQNGESHFHATVDVD